MAPQGTLTSVAFPVTHPYGRFLVGGGAGGAMRVEIVRADNDEIVFQAGGRSAEQMQPEVVDLRKLVGKQIFVRVVDHGSAGWGHINFDDFRFFDAPPQIAEAEPQGWDGDVYPYAGLPAEEAARVMKLPEGFSVKLAAAEPDVQQPIAMALDDRGRLWVAEAYTYPIRAPEGQGQRSDPDLRRHRRRRHASTTGRSSSRAESGQRHRGRVRRRVGRRRAVSAVHS